MSFKEEYKQKLVSPEEAVGVVKSGDWVDYGHFACAPTFLDPILAKRVDELNDVKVRAVTYPGLGCRGPGGSHQGKVLLQQLAFQRRRPHASRQGTL